MTDFLSRFLYRNPPAPEVGQLDLHAPEEDEFTNEGAPPPGVVRIRQREPVRVSYRVAPPARTARPILSLTPDALSRRRART